MFRLSVSFFVLLAVAETTLAVDPLPSWNEGQARRTIVQFVQQVSTKGSADFVPPAERIAGGH